MDSKNLIEVVACVKGGTMKDRDGKDIQLFRCVRLCDGKPIEDEYTLKEVERGFYYPRLATKWFKVVDEKGNVKSKQFTVARIGELADSSRF